MSVHRLSRIAAALLQRLSILLVALLLAEGAVRLVHPGRPMSWSVNEWDPVVGIRQHPGARGFVACRDYRMELVISDQGLRDRTYTHPRPPGRRRILVLGDSFTCGYGVAAGQTYPKRCEARLRRETRQDGWEVINAGVGSTGTAHQVAWYETSGRTFTPDLVVCCFLPTNDFWDNATAGLYVLAGDSLQRRPARRSPGRWVQRLTHSLPSLRFLAAHSRLVSLVQEVATRLHYRRLARRSDGELVPPSEVLARRLELTRRLFLRLRRDTAVDGTDLLVMVIPPGDDREGRLLTDRLVTALRAADIPVMLLGPALAAGRARGVACYYPHDGHWTAAGHAVVADTLASWILEHLPPPSRDDTAASPRPTGSAGSAR